MINKDEFVAKTSLVGVVRNGLSHMVDDKSLPHFAIALIRGIGSNLTDKARKEFASEVFQLTKCPSPSAAIH